MGLLDNIKVAASVEVPHNHHPVVVQPPQVKREEHPFTGFIDFQGLKIDVENRKGDYRRGEDKDGHAWKVLMHNHYGEIRDTEGVDGDNLDVYVGPNHDASTVVVIRQHRPDTGAYDEDKVMVGFDSVEEAIGAYKKQYDKPGFFKDDDYLAMPIGQFWRWVHDTRKHGKKVAGVGLSEKIALSDDLIERANTQGRANRWKRLQVGSATDHALVDRTMRQERVLDAEVQRRAAARAAAAAPAPAVDAAAAARSQSLAARVPHPEARPKIVMPPPPGAAHAAEGGIGSALRSGASRLGGLIAGNKGKLLLGAGALAAGGLAMKAYAGKQQTPMPTQRPPQPTTQVASSPWAKQGSALPDIIRPTIRPQHWEYALHPTLKKALIAAGAGAGVGLAAKKVKDESAWERETGKHSKSKAAIIGAGIGGAVLAGGGALYGHALHKNLGQLRDRMAPAAQWTIKFVQEMRASGMPDNQIKEMLKKPGMRETVQAAQQGVHLNNLAKKVNARSGALVGGAYGAAVGAFSGARGAHARNKDDEAEKDAEHVEAPSTALVVEDALRPVLAHLLALYQLYYFAHWSSQGPSSYGDHQLYERLYKSTQEEFDSVAERLVGHCGEDALGGVFPLAAQWNTEWMRCGSPLLAATLGEARLAKVLLEGYRRLDAQAGLTLGLDDLLMQIANQHETNQYLLRRRAAPQIGVGVKVAATEEEEVAAQRRTGAAIAGVGAGGYAVHQSVPLVTGRTNVYHGGDAETAAKIRKGGLKTRAAMGQEGGLTAAFTTPEVNAASKDLAFVTSNKSVADQYARQAGLARAHMAANPGVSLEEVYKRIRVDPNTAMRLQMPGTAGGSVAKMNVPLWKMRQEGRLVANPEAEGAKKSARELFEAIPHEKLRKFLQWNVDRSVDTAVGERGGTYSVKGGIDSKYVRGSKNFQRLTLDELRQYAAAHPGRMGGGVALGLGGAALAGAGLHHLYRNAVPASTAG